MADILSSFISQVKIGDNIYPIGSSLFGLCSTEAATTTKEVNANNLTNNSFATLATGVTVHIKFSNANSASSPLLKVGNTTAKSIINPGGDTTWPAGAIISFTYDGANWVMNGGKNNADVSQGTNSGEIVIDGTTVKPKDINNAAYHDVDSSIASNSSSTNVPTSAAVASYVATATAGLTGVMHFKGKTTTTMSDGLTTPTVIIGGENYTPESGDVVLSGDHQEYIWTETNVTTHAGYWELLGDEGSYALKTSTANVAEVANWDAGSVPTLGTAIAADDITAWSANTPTAASVANGTLTITPGVAATLTYTEKSIPNVTNVGSVPSLTTASTTVVVP